MHSTRPHNSRIIRRKAPNTTSGGLSVGLMKPAPMAPDGVLSASFSTAGRIEISTHHLGVLVVLPGVAFLEAARWAWPHQLGAAQERSPLTYLRPRSSANYEKEGRRRGFIRMFFADNPRSRLHVRVTRVASPFFGCEHVLSAPLPFDHPQGRAALLRDSSKCWNDRRHRHRGRAAPRSII